MKEDANQKLVEGHHHIVMFLNEWRGKLGGFIKHDKQWKLLDYAVEEGLKPSRETDKRSKRSVGKERSDRSKVKSALNRSLGDFCKEYQISPPIQLYFGSAELRKQIIHFACCERKHNARSAKYVSPKELQKTLVKAVRLFIEDSKGKHAYEGSNIIESVIKQLLRDDALLHLREKLKPRDENDYRPLQLECGVMEKDGDQADKLHHNRKWESFDFDDLLKPFGVFVLSSNVGTGKTTFLRFLQLELLQKDFIPIFIRARKIEKWDTENISDFVKHIAGSFHSQLQEVQVTAFLESAFRNKRVFLFVDGLDQIQGVGNEYEQLVRKILKLTDNNLIIASRPSAVTSQEREENITYLRLKPFDTNIQKSYFAEHYKRAKELSVNCPDLVAIPMLAYMVRTLIEKGEDKDVKNRAGLYKKFIKHVLTEYRHGGFELPLGLRNEIGVNLQKISYYALNDKDKYIQRIPLEYYSKIYDERKLTIKLEEIDKLTRCGLVNLTVESTGDFLCFTHQFFQEYLAAEWARKSKKRIKCIFGRMWDPKWRETIKFLAGMLGEDFIKRIYSPRCKDNCIHSRLFLAAECCSESTATAEAEKAVLEQLKGLICEPLFMEDALTSLSKLNSPEAIDVLVSVATCTFSNIPNTVRKKCQSLAITGIPQAKAGIRSEHVDAFVGAIQRSDEIVYDEMLNMLVELVRTLTPSQIDRIVDTVCSCGAAGSYSKKGGAPLLKRLTGTHIEKIFRLIADNDEALKRRALNILDWLTENWTRHAEPGKLPLSTQHVDALVRSAESGSFTVKVGVFNVLSNLITEPIVSSSHIDWMVRVITKVEGYWPSLHKLTGEIQDIFLYRLSSSQRSQIIDLVFHEDTFMQTRGKWLVRDCLADSLLEEEITRIISILCSGSSALWLKGFFGHILVRVSHRLTSSHLDQIIDLLMTRDEIAAPTAVDVLSRATETVTVKQEQVKRILGAIGQIDGDFEYNPTLWDGETKPPLYFRWSLQPIAEDSVQNNITKILSFLESESSFQQKVGIALLTSLGDRLPDECTERIVNLVSQGTPVVTEGALICFFLVPEKLSTEGITRVIDCLSSPYIRVRDATALCLRAVVDRLSPYVAKIAGLLDHRDVSVANMALGVLATIPNMVTDEAIAKAITMLERQKYEYCRPSIRWWDVQISSFISSFGARFDRKHISQLVKYARGRRRFLKKMALDILAEVEQYLPSDVFYELVDYLTGHHRRIHAVPRELLRSTSHPLKKQHVHRIVRCFGRAPNSWVMRQKISEIPPRLLSEHIGFFVELLNHQNPFAQVNSLAILAYLVDKLHPRHIKRVERLLCSSDEEVQTAARKFLEKTYQLRGLPC